MAIVKANAYGHGIEGISRWAQELGTDFFGVVCLKEARMLRETGINKPILILNYTDAESIPAAVDLDLRLNVMDEHVLKTLNQYAQKKGKRVDITDVPHPSVGDEVVLIGKQGKEEVTAEEIAQRTGTINYEILSSLSQRVDRTFWD